MKRYFQSQPLADDGHQEIDRHGYPDLAFHSVFRGAVEAFDPQMLLDPFEEQFHLPALLVELGDGCCRDLEIVGEEDQWTTICDGFELDASQLVRIVLERFLAREHDRLVAHDTTGSIAWGGVNTPHIRIGLCTGDEECACQVKCAEPMEVQVRTIHHVKAASFGHQQIQCIYIVHLPIADVDEAWN